MAQEHAGALAEWPDGPGPAPHTPHAPVFTGMRIDRAAALRHDPGRMATLHGEPTAAVVAASADGVLVDPSVRAPSLARRRVAGDGEPLVDPAEAILLGTEDGAALFAVDLEDLDPAARSRVADGAERVSLRDAGALLAHAEAALAAYLTALLARFLIEGWVARSTAGA